MSTRVEICAEDDGTFTVDAETSDVEAAEKEPSGNEQTFKTMEEAIMAAAQMLKEASMAPPEDASQIEPDEGMPEEEQASMEEEDAMTGSFKPQRTPFKPMTR